MEAVAADAYGKTFACNVYVVGFVVNPSICHLGCSPDRRVYDPEADDKVGLLEIMCPIASSVTDCTYLMKTAVGSLQLKTTRLYYYQVMG